MRGDVVVARHVVRDLGRVTLVVYCSGVIERIGLSEYSFDKDRWTVEVNVLGAIAWLNQAAMLFERMGSGSIVGISSIAGERGRVRNPVYNATKAAFTTYLEALRNRLTRKGVHVLTVKPGFVNTAFLEGIPNTFWVISPEAAAADIWKSLRRRRQTVFVPARWGLVALALRNIPSSIFRRLSI